MWDTCAVDLRVNLPRTVAAEVEEVQRNDPGDVESNRLLRGHAAHDLRAPHSTRQRCS